MKMNRLLYLLPFLLLLSCGDEDNDGPSISIDIPSEIDNESAFDLTFEITDESLISSYTLKIEDDNDELFSIISTPETKSVNRSESVFISTNSTEVRLSIRAEDENGNVSNFNQSININAALGGKLALNFKLTYDGSPLVMFEPLTYTTGEQISFTRISSYLSDIALGETIVKDIDFVRLDDGHLDDESAINGFTYEIPSVPEGNYQNLSFRYGISAEDNAKKPADFPSGHPLAASGEFWVSWSSYIFVKIEGRIDTDGDGQQDEGFALHLGSDEAARIVDWPSNISISNGETSSVEMKIDLKEVLGGDTSPYDLRADGQIHSLSQIPLIRLLADNLKTNTKF